MSAGLLAFLLVLVPVVIGLIAVMALRPRHDPAAWEAAFSRLARTVGGRLFVRDGEPRVRFAWHGREVEVDGDQGVRLLIRDPGFRPPRLEVEADGGSDDLELAGTSSPEGKEFFATSGRRAFEALAKAVQGAYLDVRFDDALRFSGPGHVNGDVLSAFVLQALRLAEQARIFASQSSEVAILEQDERAGADCPVCGAALAEEVVRCASCRAPHHRECWDYVGTCATFGCGSAAQEPGPAGRP